MATQQSPYDCIIIGAGPGGLQAAIHLGRYNRRVLLIDRGGGRTTHADHIVNYLGLEEVSGGELIKTGLRQIQGFGVEVRKETVVRVTRDENYFVETPQEAFEGSFVIVSAGSNSRSTRK